MKIFTKLFLSILLILTVTLSIVHYITVSESFETSLNTEIEAAVRQHQIIMYAISTDLQTASSLSDIDEDRLDSIIKLVENKFSTVVIKKEYSDKFNPNEGNLRYWIDDKQDAVILRLESVLSTSVGIYIIETRSNISQVYDNSHQMSQRYRNTFLVAEIAGTLFAAILAVSVTAPIRKLTRASREMAAGNYDVIIPDRRSDELGELSRSFRVMKQSVTDTMDQLELASKQKDDFVGNFAHELKTPMTSIIGYADTIYSGDLTEEEMREAAKYILNEGLRLESLSFKLLELITIKDNKFVMEDTSTYIFWEDTQQTVMPAAAKKGVKVTFACETAYIRIEYDLFKTMVMNLIDNAFKSGGTQVDVTGMATPEGYRITITDNGRGIPPEELSRITEAFYMIDKARSRKEHGAGLGLALCERVARLHGTKLEFKSKVGEGTSVSFVMQICEEVDEE
ncbi:Signal transduction histidine kinase [Ruminococcaceae bacterium YRB3002]|nr:Signal transduction histidine kinase [Ruminococcaceae bacterium YRB3002]